MPACFLKLVLTLVIGFALPHQEHLDYEIIQSLNPEFNKAVIRVNVFREHRQTVQVRLVPKLCGVGSVLLAFNGSKVFSGIVF